MSDEIKNLNNETAAQTAPKATDATAAPAKPAAAPAAAAKPAARPAAPAAPAKPAVNELKPRRVEADKLHEEMKRLHDEGMDFLLNLVGVDREDDGLAVVYQVENTTTGKSDCVECVVTDRENPQVPSVTDLWDIAHTYEREAYDFYGIVFTNHPDMRRLFMREG